MSSAPGGGILVEGYGGDLGSVTWVPCGPSTLLATEVFSEDEDAWGCAAAGSWS